MRIGDGPSHDGRISTTPAASARREGPGPRAERTTVPEPAAEPSPFARVLGGLGREVDRGEAILRRTLGGARGGQELGNLELLALQAGVYRYSEAVDLSAKLVDRAANGVKTVLQGQ